MLKHIIFSHIWYAGTHKISSAFMDTISGLFILPDLLITVVHGLYRLLDRMLLMILINKNGFEVDLNLRVKWPLIEYWPFIKMRCVLSPELA